MLNTIADWKLHYEGLLPAETEVIARNKAITSQYARLYHLNPVQFKWAGMAAFASHHVGLGLIPFEIKAVELMDIKTSCSERGLKNDLNLIRHLNNRIFDDIAWVHFAYLEGGIKLLKKLLSDDPHYREMLPAFVLMDAEPDEHHSIWEANKQLLYHEQARVVQPVFERLGGAFRKIITFCASLDFSANHSKTNWKYHSSFVAYMWKNRFDLIWSEKSLPSLVILEQRWPWLEERILPRWRQVEKEDRSLDAKMRELIIYV